MNIFVIDLAARRNMGVIDFIPRREENIILSDGKREVECKILNIVYYPKQNSVLVFVDVRSDYKNIIDEIEW